MKNLFKNFLIRVIALALLAIVPYFLGVSDSEHVLETFKDIKTLTGMLFLVAVILSISFYIKKINPRKTYFCVDTKIATVVLTVAILGVSGTFILTTFFESTWVKLLLMFLYVVLISFIIYATIYRGVSIYENGTIRVFKFKIRTYYSAIIEKVDFEYSGILCIITITINGEKNTFIVPTNAVNKLKIKKDFMQEQ